MGFLPGRIGPGRCNKIADDGLSGCSTAAKGAGRWPSDRTCHLRLAHRHHVHPDPRGWLYLAVVEDLFSRMVVGWSMAETMESRLVVDALEMAIAGRRPLADLLAHSDRGSQYASDHYHRTLAAAGIVCSMSEVGQCWDNAPVESFFGRLKTEPAPEVFATRDQARAELFEYLEVFYNRVRLHSSLGFVSPTEFERAYHQSHP
jgi:putative transposase